MQGFLFMYLTDFREGSFMAPAHAVGSQVEQC